MRLGRCTSIAGTFAVIALGCGAESRTPSVAMPTAPSPTPAASAPTVTLTGRVSERVSGGPASGATVTAGPILWSAPWSGPPRWVHVDAAGRYQLTAPQDPGVAYVKAWKDGYVQQCAVSVTLQGDVSLDLSITAFGDVLTSGLPTAPNARHISGVVYEVSGDGRRPLPNAWVGWEGILDGVFADTRTDAQGRYRLCGMPTGRVDALFAVRLNSNRPVYLSVEPGSDAVVDFEVP